MSSNPSELPDNFPQSQHVFSGGTYRAASGLVLTITIMLFIEMGLSVVLGAMCLIEVTVFADQIAGDEVFDTNTDMFYLGYGCLGILYLPVYLSCAVLFCMWVYRANKNARALGAQRMEFTPGWCAGWFFVPIANLFKPFQAVREIYQASDPDADALNWRSSHVPAGGGGCGLPRISSQTLRRG